MTAIHRWHSQYHQCHHEGQSLHRIRRPWWLQQAWHSKGLGMHWSLWLRTNHSSTPPPPSPSPSLVCRGGCRRVAEGHPDRWRCCSSERWWWRPDRLGEWGSSASHGSVVRGDPFPHGHWTLNGHPPPILQPRLRSPPEASLQPDFLRHLCGGEAFARRVSSVPHGLISGVQRGAPASHYHEGVSKRGLHQPHVHRRFFGIFQGHR